VKCLNSLEGLCPSKEEYSNLCFLLSLPKLSDHVDYQNWNPSNARVQCFKDILPLIEKFLPIVKVCGVLRIVPAGFEVFKKIGKVWRNCGTWKVWGRCHFWPGSLKVWGIS